MKWLDFPKWLAPTCGSHSQRGLMSTMQIFTLVYTESLRWWILNLLVFKTWINT